MTPFDILLLSGVAALAVMANMRNELIGGYRLLSWMKRRLGLLKGRGQKSISEKEQKAIQETLIACERLGRMSFEEWNFKSATLSLINEIAIIYHPRAKPRIEQSRLEDVLEALQEANQRILHVIHLPQVEYVRQFRVAHIFERYKASSHNPRGTGANKTGIKTQLLES